MNLLIETVGDKETIEFTVALLIRRIPYSVSYTEREVNGKMRLVVTFTVNGFWFDPVAEVCKDLCLIIEF